MSVSSFYERTVGRVPWQVWSGPSPRHTLLERSARGVEGRRRIALHLALAVGLGGLYALGALFPFWFLNDPAAGAAFFPPAGLTVAALLLSPRRTWPLWMLAIAVAEVWVDMAHGLAFATAIGFAAANIVEPLIGAELLLAVPAWRRTTRGWLLAYVSSCVVGGPLFGALTGATVSWTGGLTDAWGATLGKWWLGDALGVLAVGTVILAYVQPRSGTLPARRWEVPLTAAIATATIAVPAELWHRPLLFLVLPVMMFAGVRGGYREVSTCGFFVAFAVAWAASTGRADGLFASGTATEHLVFMQLFLAVTLLTALTLAVEVTERRRAEQASNLATSAQARAELVAAAAASNERRRIVRETHDIVGHALNVMLLQAGAARRSIDSDPDTARAFLTSIEETGRDAFRDLDVALGLADRSPELVPSRGLASVPELVESMRTAGLDVELSVRGLPREVPRLVDWSAYRIVQEALTNVAKHAPRGHASVAVAYQSDDIVLSVTNDGVEQLHTNSTGGHRAARNGRNGRDGRGLVGLKERVAVLGGTIDAGSTSDHRFQVVARLPLRGTRH
jgi:signal transduction histidine kinase